VPEDELPNYISVYGLRNYSENSGNLVRANLYIPFSINIAAKYEPPIALKQGI